MSESQSEINARVLSSERLTDKLGARTVHGGMIAVASQVIRLFLQIASAAVLARLIAPEEFGLVAMAATVTALLSAVTELNVSTASVQREEVDQDTASAIFLIGLAASVIMALLGMAAMPVASWFFNDDRVGVIVLALVASTPVRALGAQHFALLMRNMQWFKMQAVSLAGIVAGIVAAILAAWLYDAGYWALVIQGWASAIVTTALSWALCPWRPTRVRDWSGGLGSMRFGVNLTVAMLMNYLNRRMDNILIGRRWGSVELGFYARAYDLLLAPLNFFTGPMGTAMVPALSRLQNEPEKWRRAFLDALAVVAIVGGAIASVLFGAAEPIVRIVFGPGWDQTGVIFSYLCIGMLASVPLDLTGWIFISRGQTHRMLQWGFVSVPATLAAFFIGLPHGAAGVALAYGVSRFLIFLPSYWWAVRGTSLTLRDVLSAIAAPWALAIVVGLGLKFATQHASLVLDVVLAAVAGLTYCAAMALAVWTLKPYAEIKQRGLHMLHGALARLRRPTPHT